jgi:hypothetical protein
MPGRYGTGSSPCSAEVRRRCSPRVDAKAVVAHPRQPGGEQHHRHEVVVRLLERHPRRPTTSKLLAFAADRTCHLRIPRLDTVLDDYNRTFAAGSTRAGPFRHDPCRAGIVPGGCDSRKATARRR